MDMLIVRKGQFSINQVAKKLNRISSQIRYRFAQLKSSLKHKYGEWSLEEDKKLLDLVEKFGKKSWSKIAEHIPDRGRVQIRHRYTNLRKRLAMNPELSLESLARFKRPVHSKRKETNIKCLMELSGIEEPPPADASDSHETQDSTLQVVEQIIGPDEKKKRRHPMDPRDLSPCRFPDLEDDRSPVLIEDDPMDVPDDPMPAEEERDPLKSPETRKNPPNKSSRKKKPRQKHRNVEPVCSSIMSEDTLEGEEPEPVPESKQVTETEPKPRSAELYGPILEYYTTASEFCGELAKPAAGQSSRKPSRAETLNSVLKFNRYKYFEADNADWTFEADRSDPYVSEVFKMIEKRDSVGEDSEEDEKTPDDRLLPPCLTNFEGFYNLLVDMGFNEDDLNEPDDKVDALLKKFYCEDDETVSAVNRWERRLATLFAWPAALSGVSLVTDDQGEDKSKVVRSSSSQKHVDVKTEPICDDECSRLSNLDLDGVE